jgi:hypothetical protein
MSRGPGSAPLVVVAVIVALCGLAAYAGPAAAAGPGQEVKLAVTFAGSGSGTYNAKSEVTLTEACGGSYLEMGARDRYTFKAKFSLEADDPTATGTPSSDGSHAWTMSSEGCGEGDVLPPPTVLNCTAPYIGSFYNSRLSGSSARYTLSISSGLEIDTPHIHGEPGCSSSSIGAPGAFTSELDGKVHFSLAELERHGSLSIPVDQKVSVHCGVAAKCDIGNCREDELFTQPPDTSCSAVQAYSATITVRLKSI